MRPAAAGRIVRLGRSGIDQADTPRRRRHPLQNRLSFAMLSNGTGWQDAIKGCSVMWRRVSQVMDLKAKVEKYESKAAHCKESAQQAMAGPQRAIYEVLAGYYSELALDFRNVIEKRSAATSAARPEVIPTRLGNEAAGDVTPWSGTADQRQLGEDEPATVTPDIERQDGPTAA
jgi:hypothetical protein